MKGITTHAIKTLGRVRVDFNNYKIDFHFVADDSPIIEAGILGTEFFRENGAQINYRENYLEFNGQIILFHNISYEKNELNQKQNENVAKKSHVNCEFLQKDEDLILINNDDYDFTNDYFREKGVRKNKEKHTNKIKTFHEINDVYEGGNISQKNSSYRKIFFFGN